MKSSRKGVVLFSVDLEDVRDWVREGEKYEERVPVNTARYLEFLSKHDGNATFFVVGSLARRYPSLIRDIVEEGHEIACHGDRHLQLDKLNRETFRSDLLANLESLNRAGASDIVGFRAPTFSLTVETGWAYDVLAELDFEYSSSVLPARNPLYGWSGFGRKAKKMSGKIWEIPITLYDSPFPRVPVAGGVYFRIIPFSLAKRAIRKVHARKEPVLTYLHPYDIDTGQERFMHPDLNDNWFMNQLMYVGRSRVMDRLEKMTTLCEYEDYRAHMRRKLTQ